MSKDSHEKLRSLHPQAELQIGSFVLYRSEAAIIDDISNEKKQVKMQVRTETGKKISVRPKDILLLSSRTQASLPEITQLLKRDELEEGWQLLLEMGRSCQLLEIAEVVFAGNGPSELYNAFCLVNETPYFKGSPEKIMVRSTQEVSEELERKQRKQQEEEQWQNFYQHHQTGKYSDQDQPFITEIEEIAFGERPTCRLFREIKLEPTPENAHEWLLRQQLWNEPFNPYLRRNQIDKQAPQIGQLLTSEKLAPWQQLLLSYQEALSGLSSLEDNLTQTTQVAPEILLELEQILSRFCDQQYLYYPPPLDTSGSSEASHEEWGKGYTSNEIKTPGISSGTSQKPIPETSQSEASSKPGLWRSETRRDLTHLAAWAIDDPWSNDPDDAISLEKTSSDSASLWVHIADPASLIPFGSALADEAMQRGATAYIPEGSIPMLPKELVQILGLGLQPVSMALSMQVHILPPKPVDDVDEQPKPTVKILDFCRSWVRVQRLSYDQADDILSDKQPHLLQQVWKLCQAHEQLRKSNNSVQFNMYNTKVVAGEPITVESLPNTPARDLVAEAMLMTGSAMALFAHAQQLPIAFLCQPPPKEELAPLNSMANMFSARKAMNPSVVRSKANCHSSIGVPMYTRGTSPLRRYLDLLTHQQLHAFMLAAEGHKVRPLNTEELLYCASQAELRVNRINRAQRSSQQHWQMLYLKQKGKKHVYKAIVLDIRGLRQNSGCKALCGLPEIGIEALVFSKEPLRLNQELELNLKSIQLNLREANFQIAGK